MKPLSVSQRVRNFAARPTGDKVWSIGQRLRTVFPNLPVPFRLPHGGWYLIGNSYVDNALLSDGFESDEIFFVSKYLKPGMTVLDVGAHHGLYTLLASERVGRNGKVVACEPSPRERKQLLRNVRLNGCNNVHIEPYALGSERSSAELYLVEGGEDGCNSLRPPVVNATTRRIAVDVITLDDVISRNKLQKVHFIKMDVEGAELETLRGGLKLLQHVEPPILLVEVFDIRTDPWGYKAREIVQLLNRMGFRWFRLLGKGSIQEVRADLETYDANLVAIPEGRISEMSQFATI